MRDVNHHSHLADIVRDVRLRLQVVITDSSLQAMIRMLMGVSGLVPVPSDALVTPVTFLVQRRGLRGILADFDKRENGTRELSGEWVVGKRTWQRLQAEWQASGRHSPGAQHTSSRPIKRKERVILYIHGGTHRFYASLTC